MMILHKMIISIAEDFPLAGLDKANSYVRKFTRQGPEGNLRLAATKKQPLTQWATKN